MQLRFYITTILAVLANSAFLSAAMAAPSLSEENYIAANPSNQLAYASVTPHPDMQAARVIASTFFAADDYHNSQLMYQSICQRPEATAEDFRGLGESHFRQKSYGRAAQCFNRAIQIDPKADAARLRLVEAYLAAKDRTQAKQACAMALTCVSDSYSRNQLETLQKVLAQPDLQTLLSGSSSGRTYAARGPQG